MDCSSLVAIEFCEEIEDFVTELSLRHWWNNGTSRLSLWTGSFLALCNIPRRVGMIKMRVWRENIHAMLFRIPIEIPFNDSDNSDDDDDDDNDDDDDDGYEPENGYFDSINSQLANYEHVQDVVPFLELALWKTKMIAQSNGDLISDDLKLECRGDSISMFAIIFPNVLSFLVGEYLSFVPMDE
jgi:hypothetical protein